MKKFLNRTWAEIDTDALLHNFKTIKQTTDTKVCAVVKANAYGHGVDIVAPVLQKAGADFFGVSNIEEAIELRQIGITKPILVLGYTPCEFATELANNNISQCVYSHEYADELSKEAAKYNLKIKKFPSNIFAGIFGFEEVEYFEAEEGAQKVPEVNFY